MINKLRNQIHKEWTVPSALMLHVYNNTPADCALRKMLIFTFASICGGNLVEEASKDTMPFDALWDLTHALLAVPRPPKLSKNQYSQVKMCTEFHVHEEGVTCKTPPK